MEVYGEGEEGGWDWNDEAEEGNEDDCEYPYGPDDTFALGAGKIVGGSGGGYADALYLADDPVVDDPAEDEPNAPINRRMAVGCWARYELDIPMDPVVVGLGAGGIGARKGDTGLGMGLVVCAALGPATGPTGVS